MSISSTVMCPISTLCLLLDITFLFQKEEKTLRPDITKWANQHKVKSIIIESNAKATYTAGHFYVEIFSVKIFFINIRCKILRMSSLNACRWHNSPRTYNIIRTLNIYVVTRNGSSVLLTFWEQLHEVWTKVKRYWIRKNISEMIE